MSQQLSIFSPKGVEQMVTLASLMRSPAIQNVIRYAGNRAYNYAASLGQSELGFPAAPAMQNASSRSLGRQVVRQGRSNRRKQKTSGRKRGRQSLLPLTRSPTGSANDVRPRIQCTFVIPITTATTTGILNANFWLGFKNTTFSGSMNSISAVQYSNLAGIFNFQKINGLTLRFEPVVAYTTSGWAGFVVYTDPSVAGATIISTAQQYMEKPYSYVGDIKECSPTVTWTPSDEQQREFKETGDASAATGALTRNYAPANIYYTVNTNATSGATFVGHLILVADITFHGLN
jgi:hypothetical protein